jgi:mono/diheme cytochrome c family protein
VSNEQRYYKVNTLHKWFAVGSILLMLVLIAVLLNDYAQEFKKYQRRFRAMESVKVREQFEGKSELLKSDEAYLALQQQLAEAQQAAATHREKAEQARERLGEKQAALTLADKEFQAAKAQADAARYRYEEALVHEGDVQSAQRVMLEWEGKREGLRQTVEKAEAAVEAEKAAIDATHEQVEALERQANQVAFDADVLERRLQRVDREAMSLPNKVADMVRDLPVLNITQPYYKIDQVVLDTVSDDVVFANVPKVDRCTTCHQGIMNPMFEGEEQPYGAHPNLELFLSSQSAHPVEDFGCTVCHSGRGRGTTFASVAHTPSDADEAEEWEAAHGWEGLHHWDEPMYPLNHTQAGCFQCHGTQTTVKGADTLNLGMALVEKAGCNGCHQIDVPKWKNFRKVGPGLTHVASKTTPDWTFHWIRNPKGFRANTWMPHFYGQQNNSDPESEKRANQEIHAMVHYLFTKSEAYPMQPAPAPGNPERGRELVESVGCTGCHRLDDSEVRATLQSLRLEHGPSLVGLGTKTNEQWLFNWLKNPSRYHALTLMPNLRLSDQEAADIASFLVQDKRDGFLESAPAPFDESALDEIVLGYMRKTQRADEAGVQLAAMSSSDKLMYAGETLIRQYGCFSCHDIPGFETELPIGTELTAEGSKSIHAFDFGYVDIPHTVHDWFSTKLKTPRIFDVNKVKPPEDKLRMPNFYFSDEEATAIVTVLLGLVKNDPHNQLKMARSAENLHIERGQALVRQYNCQGCHTIEGDGAAILPSVAGWLNTHMGYSEGDAETLAESFGPPDLDGEGDKVQSQWLFGFLHRPEIIRPWLKVRMPTFNLPHEHNNALVSYFAYRDEAEFPFEAVVDPPLEGAAFEAGHALFSPEIFNCGTCHIQGDQLPPGTPDRWAPNLAMAERRLKPDWIAAWLRDPQAVSPGTKMPTYFDPNAFDESGPPNVLSGDENAQILALRDYVLAIGLLQSSPPIYEPLAMEVVAAPESVPEGEEAVTEASPEAVEDDFWD